jgi:hypothetical protein
VTPSLTEIRSVLPTVLTILTLGWTGLCNAQTGVVQLVCPWGGNFQSSFLTISYDSRTMRMESIDQAGNIGPAQGIVPASLEGMQSNFSDNAITIENRYWRFVLNRYSGVLQSVNKPDNHTVYSQPCTPYEKPSTRRY